MSTDYYLCADDRTCVYIGYSWGAGLGEVEDRKAVAEWLEAHIGQSVKVCFDVPYGWSEQETMT